MFYQPAKMSSNMQPILAIDDRDQLIIIADDGPDDMEILRNGKSPTAEAKVVKRVVELWSVY